MTLLDQDTTRHKQIDNNDTTKLDASNDTN